MKILLSLLKENNMFEIIYRVDRLELAGIISVIILFTVLTILSVNLAYATKEIKSLKRSIDYLLHENKTKKE